MAVIEVDVIVWGVYSRSGPNFHHSPANITRLVLTATYQRVMRNASMLPPALLKLKCKLQNSITISTMFHYYFGAERPALRFCPSGN
jgi:hypothetical protein